MASLTIYLAALPHDSPANELCAPFVHHAPPLRGGLSSVAFETSFFLVVFFDITTSKE